MLLTEIFSLEDMNVQIDAGLVTIRSHETEPLRILNYSDRCVHTPGGWNEITSVCRGLIFNEDTLEVIARGYNKFFNYGQKEAPVWALSDEVLSMDKADGSLGILYPLPSGGWAVATRGSFHSDQAVHATALLNTRYTDWLWNAEDVLKSGATLTFEIIYPDNRIVLNYNDMDDLVLLGAVDNATGDPMAPDVAKMFYSWPGPVTEVFGVLTLQETLAMEPRSNAEGLVMLNFETNELMKFKQEDYIQLHKIVFGLNARLIWERMIESISTQESFYVDKEALKSAVLDGIPDEFVPWASTVFDIQYNAAYAVLCEADAIYSITCYKLFETVPASVKGKDRGRLAVAIKDDPLKSYVFMYADNRTDREVMLSILKGSKPSATWSLKEEPIE